MPPPAITLAIVGAAYPNRDGSNRQFSIAMCSPGDPLHLVPEPDNPIDEHAIAVFSEHGEQIGYVTSERAPYLNGLMRAGHELHAIYQARTKWGAFARIGIDEVPGLIPQATKPAAPVEDDNGFYPDFIPPDD